MFLNSGVDDRMSVSLKLAKLHAGRPRLPVWNMSSDSSRSIPVGKSSLILIVRTNIMGSAFEHLLVPDPDHHLHAATVHRTCCQSLAEPIDRCHGSVGLSIFDPLSFRGCRHLPTARVWNARNAEEPYLMCGPTLLGICLSRDCCADHTHSSMNIYAVASEGFNATLNPSQRSLCRALVSFYTFLSCES